MEQDEDFLSVQAVKVTLSQPALQVRAICRIMSKLAITHGQVAVIQCESRVPLPTGRDKILHVSYSSSLGVTTVQQCFNCLRAMKPGITGALQLSYSTWPCASSLRRPLLL